MPMLQMYISTHKLFSVNYNIFGSQYLPAVRFVALPPTIETVLFECSSVHRFLEPFEV